MVVVVVAITAGSAATDKRDSSDVAPVRALA